NVRELQSVLRQAMLQGAGHILLPEFLPAELRMTAGDELVALDGGRGAEAMAGLVESLLAGGGGDVHARCVEAVERVLLPAVLKQTTGHQAQGAALLGLSRGTLRQRLRSLGFSIDKVFHEEE